MGEECCECSSCGEGIKSAEDVIRDLINDIAVMKKEGVEGVTTKISEEAAKRLTAKLEKLVEKVGHVCD